MSVIKRKQLVKFGIFPSIIILIVSILYVYYQYQSFNYKIHYDSSFVLNFLVPVIWNIISSNAYFLVFSIIISLLFLLIWLFIPILCRGAITKSVFNIRSLQKNTGVFANSLLHFFPLFEASLLFRSIAPITFFSQFSFVARNTSIEAGFAFIPVFIFLSIIGLIAMVFFMFIVQVIIIKKLNFSKSVKYSSKLVVTNFFKSIKLLILLFLIEFRIIINVIFILGIPLGMFFIAGILASVFSFMVTVIIITVISLISTLFAVYIMGTLFVFKETIWTISFIELDKEMEEK